MKRLLIVVAVALVVLAACDTGVSYQTNMIPPLGLQTVQEVMTFVADRVEYQSDQSMYGESDEWQLPQQTYVWESGDCEDFAILAVYLLKQELGIEAYGVGGYNRDFGISHMWVLVDGVNWEATAGVIDDTLPEDFPLRSHTWSYDELMRAASAR